MGMTLGSCECTTTYAQAKLFDRWNLLIICVDCGEVLREVAIACPPFEGEEVPFSPELTE